MNSGTHNFFGITTFEIRHIFAAFTRSYKSTPSIALILASSVVILSWSISLDDLIIWVSFMNVFMIMGAGTGVINCTNAGLYWGSWACSPITSSGWVAVWFWTKMAGLLERPLPKALRSAYSSKLVRWATLNFKNPTLSDSVRASQWVRSLFSMFLSWSWVLSIFRIWAFCEPIFQLNVCMYVCMSFKLNVNVYKCMYMHIRYELTYSNG